MPWNLRKAPVVNKQKGDKVHLPSHFPQELAKIKELEQMIISGDLEAPEEGIVRGPLCERCS